VCHQSQFGSCAKVADQFAVKIIGATLKVFHKRKIYIYYSPVLAQGLNQKINVTTGRRSKSVHKKREPQMAAFHLDCIENAPTQGKLGRPSVAECAVWRWSFAST